MLDRLTSLPDGRSCTSFTVTSDLEIDEGLALAGSGGQPDGQDVHRRGPRLRAVATGLRVLPKSATAAARRPRCHPRSRPRGRSGPSRRRRRNAMARSRRARRRRSSRRRRGLMPPCEVRCTAGRPAAGHGQHIAFDRGRECAPASCTRLTCLRAFHIGNAGPGKHRHAEHRGLGEQIGRNDLAVIGHGDGNARLGKIERRAIGRVVVGDDDRALERAPPRSG